MTTGTICPVTGFYRSTCPDHARVRIIAGSAKPTCPICGKPTVWEWIGKDGGKRDAKGEDGSVGNGGK